MVTSSSTFVFNLLCYLQYFEQDDPELYISKIKYIKENDVDDMELSFVEEEFKDGRLEKVQYIQQSHAFPRDWM